jgi:protein TonB
MSEGRKKLLFGLGGLIVLVMLGLLLYSLVSGKSKPKKAAPKISLIPMKPPPPPPPPKEEKKPEPPKEQKEVKEMPAPPKDASPAPPSQELKMDGPAGDGPSAFAAGKVTNEDISKVGKGSGPAVTAPAAVTAPPAPALPATGLFSPFGGYANMLKSEVQRLLQRSKELRNQSYRIEVQIWVAKDGSLQRHELVGSTGDADLDNLISQTLLATKAFSQPPPERMPQPIRLRINTGNR